MENNDFVKAMDSFIGQRVIDCGMRKNVNLEEAYQQFEKALLALKDTLTSEQNSLLIKLENAYSLVDGETTNYYYRAGFSDAVLFLLGWRDGEWK